MNERVFVALTVNGSLSELEEPMSSLWETVLSHLEVSGLLGSLEGEGLLLVSGETSSGSLGALSLKVLGSVLLVLPGSLGGISSLLVDDGKSLGNSLSNNLKKVSVKRYVHH